MITVGLCSKKVNKNCVFFKKMFYITIYKPAWNDWGYTCQLNQAFI